MPEHQSTSSKRLALECAHCGKRFERYVSQATCATQFCSRACRNASIKRRPIPCPECGAEFIPHLTNIKFCSPSCGIASRARGARAADDVPCGYCGMMLSRPPSRIEANAQFCDHACHTAYQQRSRGDSTCIQCGKSFTNPPSQSFRRRFDLCSKECRLAFLSQSRARISGESRNATCDHCGKPFTRKPSQLAKYPLGFCSRECRANAQRVHPSIYAPGFNDRLREMIRQRDGYRCRICNVPQSVLPIALHVHHCDFRKVDNSPDNLISLCQSCHVRVHSRILTCPVP